jgi:acetyl-CoA acetyltransferase
MGPALAMPKALDRAGLKLSDIDIVDMHEAFAAQVLSVLKMLGSAAFARARLGKDEAVGEIDIARLNVHGGSLALGHPFGATGARMVGRRPRRRRRPRAHRVVRTPRHGSPRRSVNQRSKAFPANT